MAQIITTVLAIMILALTTCTNHVTSTMTTAGSLNGIILRAPFMHINARASPMHNPAATRHQIRAEDLRISRERVKYLYGISNPQSSIESMQSQTQILESSFIMKFEVGTPPVETYGYVDTSNALCWVQCSPCIHCYKQHGRIYDSVASSTYKNIAWGDPMCSSNVIGAKVDDLRGDCSYEVRYVDGSMSMGKLARERFTFRDGHMLNDVAFGCGYFNRMKDYRPPAMIGLARYKGSLVGQLSVPQFSYHVELEYSKSGREVVGVIEFGDNMFDPQTSIPFVRDMLVYSLDLKKISVAGNSLDGVYTFQKIGIVIDSGSAITVLETKLFRDLQRRIIREMGAPIRSYWPKNMCYGSLRKAPTIVFSFKGGYNLTFCPSSIWSWSSRDGIYCLEIGESPRSMSILGMYQQRGFKVVYDLPGERVSITEMRPGECPMFPSKLYFNF